ncbi:MAG: PAS domain-containing protein [Pseudomonadota bacterium]
MIAEFPSAAVRGGTGRRGEDRPASQRPDKGASGTALARRAGTVAPLDDRAKMRLERRTLVMRGAPVDIFVGATLAVVAVAAGFGRIDPWTLAVWSCLALTVSAFRVLIWRAAARRHAGSAALTRFNRLNLVALAVKGALWGAIAPAFVSGGLWTQAFFPFAAAVLSAMSVATGGASWRSVVAFNAPLLIATALSYGVLVEGVGVAVAGIVIAYAVALGFISKFLERTILRSIRIRARDDKAFSLLEARLDAANESEARFRAIVEASRDLTIIFSPDGRITYVSPSAADLLGASPQQLVTKTTKDLTHPDDLRILREAGGKSLTRIGEARAIESICFVGADGACRVFEGRLTNMLYVPGVEGFVFVGGLKTRSPCPTHASAVSAKS